MRDVLFSAREGVAPAAMPDIFGMSKNWGLGASQIEVF